VSRASPAPSAPRHTHATPGHPRVGGGAGRDQLGRGRAARRDGGGERIAPGERRGERRRAAGPAPRIALQAALDRALRRGVDVALEVGGGDRRGLASQARDLFQRLALEGSLPREQLVQDEPEAVEVALDRGGLAAGEALGRHVGRCPDEELGITRLGLELGEPEVRDARVAAPVNHDVGRLEVAVEHAALVDRGQAGGDRARDLVGLVGRETADPPQQRREVLAVDELHRQEMEPVHLLDVVHPAHVGVRHLAREAHLLEQRLEARRVIAQLRGQELERDRLAELEVDRAVDLAHAAAPDPLDDAVAPGQHVTRDESLALGRRGRRGHGSLSPWRARTGAASCRARIR